MSSGSRWVEGVADTMFALSTPSRVEILYCLRERSMTVSELVSALGMEQSAVSHQLRILREHKLVTVERRGRARVYSLFDEEVAALLEAALRHVEGRPNGLLVGRLRRSGSAR